MNPTWIASKVVRSFGRRDLALDLYDGRPFRRSALVLSARAIHFFGSEGFLSGPSLQCLQISPASRHGFAQLEQAQIKLDPIVELNLRNLSSRYCKRLNRWRNSISEWIHCFNCLRASPHAVFKHWSSLPIFWRICFCAPEAM